MRGHELIEYRSASLNKYDTKTSSKLEKFYGFAMENLTVFLGFIVAVTVIYNLFSTIGDESRQKVAHFHKGSQSFTMTGELMRFHFTAIVYDDPESVTDEINLTKNVI